MTQPTLRLVKPADSEGLGASASRGEVSLGEGRIVAHRMLHILRRRPERTGTGTLRVLDLSPVSLSIGVLLAGRGVDVSVTRLAETEVAAELMRDADEGVEIVVSTLDRLATLLSPGAFDVVHTSLLLGSRRELPLMTALTQLGRLAGEGFVWTDRARQTAPLRRRRVRDVAARVDLGFCAHRRPIGSGLFTLSGWRPAL